MTLTLQNIPDALNDALREKALAEGKSIDQVAVEAIQTGLNLAGTDKRRDLREIVGSMTAEDAQVVETSVREMDDADLRFQRERSA